MSLTRRRFLVRSGLSLSALISSVPTVCCGQAAPLQRPLPRPQLGAYYFDGWAGRHALAGNPNEPWARNAPTHLTRRMLEEFPEREPIWGWRDDTLESMVKQIDLAADHGLAFFSFCWYWHPDKRSIEEDPKHSGLNLFLKAKNNRRLKFCLLVANHAGFLFNGPEDWKKAGELWMPYFKHPQHVTVSGKPLLIIFNPGNGSKAGFEHLQSAARNSGLPGLAIAACGPGDPQMGYTHRTHYNLIPGYAAGPQQHPYSELVAYHQKAWTGSPQQPGIPTVTAGWDKRPWEGERGLNQKPGWFFPDRTPEALARFVQSAIEWMDQHPDQATRERLLLLYAWNEFGEGGYIAPTKGDPDGKYLKALQSILK